MPDTEPERMTALQRRWSRNFPALVSIGDEIVPRYADETRVYHDLTHLGAVLDAVDLLRDEADDPALVELAAWFHDAVYDVHGTANEGASASLASSLLAPLLSSQALSEVVRLVLLTTNHDVRPGDANGAVLCDADLAVLAGSREAYDDYAARVRREYRHVPDEDFRTGRKRVLESLLDLPRLFNTSYAARHWAGPARANLERELATLG